MQYRPDIDGLRAIAIILVLLYHGDVALFPSGFIGVDVFFVISGFLITSILYESCAGHRFSFADFYNRRLWRLQPVFICFLIVTTFFAIVLFLPDDLMEYSRSARKTSLLIANSYFNRTTTGYFSPDTQQLPLLHMWSLSIEWQCYLLLPIVMYGAYRLLPQRYLPVLIGGCIILSWLAALYYSQTAPVQTYYLLSSRIFEFLIGAGVAFIPVKKDAINQSLPGWLGTAALATIFYVALQDTILMGYPNHYAVAVCIATGVLIAIGRCYPDQFWMRILALRPLVFIGMLSYSLYIWHWMVLVLLRYQHINQRPVILLLAYVCTFILAYLSWRYIERPARRFIYIPFRYTFISLLLIPIALTHIAGYVINHHSGFPQRFDPELVTIYKKLEQYKSSDRPLCISNTKTNIEEHCILGAENGHSRSGLLIGDSHSNHYWGLIDTFGKAANVRITAQATSSCITLPGLYLYDWWKFKHSVYQECFEQTRKYYQMIKDGHYDYVIIGEIWPNYLVDNIINHIGDARSLTLAKKRLERSLTEALEIISESGAKPVLIKTTAIMPNDIHDCIYQHFKLHQRYIPAQCEFALFVSDKEAWFADLFKQLQIKFPQLIVVDPKQIQCPHQRCTAEIDGVPIYRDKEHITDYASYRLGQLYLQQLGNPFL